MAGATVVMTDLATGAVRTEKTATDGRFAFFALPVASYSVTASNPGWATVRYNVTLEDGQQSDREFVLRMGLLSEAVTVVASGARGAAAPGPGVTPRAQVSNVVPPLPTRLCDANGRNCVTAPVKLVHVTPVYPPEALARGEQGVVILEGAIMPTGEMNDPRVLRGIDPALNAAAVEAVKQWVFTPTLIDGMPTAIIMSITVNFNIP
jgi:TonB family protein